MKINASETSIDHYHDPDSRKQFGEQSRRVYEALKWNPRGLTIKEIAHELQRFAYPVPDSSISGRLNELKDIGIVTDDNPKRKCRINSAIRKKVWTLVSGEPEQKGLFN